MARLLVESRKTGFVRPRLFPLFPFRALPFPFTWVEYLGSGFVCIALFLLYNQIINFFKSNLLVRWCLFGQSLRQQEQESCVLVSLFWVQALYLFALAVFVYFVKFLSLFAQENSMWRTHE